MATPMRLLVRKGSTSVTAAMVGISVLAASEDGGDEGSRKIYRACDLPLYDVNKDLGEDSPRFLDESEKNFVQKKITESRKAVTSFFGQFKEQYDNLKDKASIGAEHTRASLDYVQTNPGELPRVCFITVATMGGVVLGYRGGRLRKLAFAALAGTSATALCYPKQTVGLSQVVSSDIQALWKEGTDGIDLKKYLPFELNQGEKREVTQVSEKFTAKVGPSFPGDPGQSNPADKDMYSTRKV